MIMIGFVLGWIAGLAAICWLLHDGHPWFAFFVLMLTAGIRLTSKKDGRRAGVQ